MTRRAWLLPTGLILLSIVPVVASGIRVAELAGGAEVTAANARYFASPVPVLVHVVTGSLFCILGAFQFVPGLRRRRPLWHRAAGRLLVLSGLAAALSALWMTVFYPRPDDVGALLSAFRLVFGSAMAAAIVLAFAAIRRRDVGTHRAWMIRGYAIAQGGGTQALLFIPWVELIGPADRLTKALLMLAGWLINVAVAERAIRSTAGARHPAAGALAGLPSGRIKNEIS